jgi:hypothetical protein
MMLCSYQTYEFSGLDFGHVIIMFVLVVLTILIDSILEDCGVPYGLTEGQDNVYSIEGEATYGHRCQKGPFWESKGLSIMSSYGGRTLTWL